VRPFRRRGVDADIGILGGELLVDLDAPAGDAVGAEVTVLHHATAAKDFLQDR